MSLNQKNNKDKNESAMPQQIQNEVVRGIQMSINNIATQLSNVNKYTEGILGNLCKEVDETSSKLMALQENVIQMTNDMKHGDTNHRDSIGSTRCNQISQIKNVQTGEAGLHQQSPTKLYKTQDVSTQTIPIYSGNDFQTVTNHHDNVYLCQICKRKFRPEIEQNQGKLEQEYDYLDDANVTKNMPQVQVEIPVTHSQANCGNFYYSHVNQPNESTSVSSDEFTEISKLLTKTIGTVLSTPPLMKRNNSVMRETSKYVRYGVGTYEPPSPPPLIPNRFTLLRTSMVADPSFIQIPNQVTSPSMSTMRESLSNFSSSSTQTIFQADLESLSPQSSFIISKPLEYTRKLQCQIKKDQEAQFYSISASSVTSDIDEIEDTCSEFSNNTSCTQSLKTSVIPNSKSSCAQTPKTSVIPKSKSSGVQPPKTSFVPNARSSYVQPPKASVIPNSKSRCIQPPKISVIPNSRSSFVQTPKCSVVLPPKTPHPTIPTYQNPPPSKSIPPKTNHPVQQTSKGSIHRRSCSCSQASKSSILSSRIPPAHSQKLSVSSPRSSHVRPTRSSEISGRTSFAHSPGYLRPQTQQPSNMKSSTSANLKSFSSFPQKSSTISNLPSTSGPQSSSVATHSSVKQCGSVSPIFARAKNTLMEIIRKSIQLNTNEIPPEEDEKNEISKNEGKKPPKSS